MHSFQDLLEHCESKYASGAPLVENWRQVRGYFYLIDQICGLTLPLKDFAQRFPDQYSKLTEDDQNALPGDGRYAYQSMKREINRLLVCAGLGFCVGEPWDALLRSVRVYAPKKINPVLHLRKCARTDGIALADVTNAWVRTVYSSLPNAERRRNFRATVNAFNAIQQVNEIAELGIVMSPVSVVDAPL